MPEERGGELTVCLNLRQPGMAHGAVTRTARKPTATTSQTPNIYRFAAERSRCPSLNLYTRRFPEYYCNGFLACLTLIRPMSGTAWETGECTLRSTERSPWRICREDIEPQDMRKSNMSHARCRHKNSKLKPTYRKFICFPPQGGDFFFSEILSPGGKTKYPGGIPFLFRTTPRGDWGGQETSPHITRAPVS